MRREQWVRRDKIGRGTEESPELGKGEGGRDRGMGTIERTVEKAEEHSDISGE